MLTSTALVLFIMSEFYKELARVSTSSSRLVKWTYLFIFMMAVAFGLAAAVTLLVRVDAP